MNRTRRVLHFSSFRTRFLGTFALGFFGARVLVFIAAFNLHSAEAAPLSAVFDGPPCEYSVSLDTSVPPDAPLRTFQVDERAGVGRQAELVRVPLFFAQNECRSLDDLVIVSADADSAGKAIPWQADDIRHGPDGGISRVHLWLAVDLKPDETRHFKLLKKPGPPSASTSAPGTVAASDGKPGRIDTAAGPVVFGPAGELISLPGEPGAWQLGDQGMFPSVLIHFSAKENQPAEDVVLDRTTGEREVAWAAGPLFAKVRVRISGPHETRLEQTYRIPQHGREIVVTTALFPGPRGGTVKDNRLLEGTLPASASQKISVEKIPAGLRYAIRAEHAYTVSALKSSANSAALLAVPDVIGGSNGTWALGADGHFSLNGQRGLQRGGEGEKDTLYGYWTEVRLMSTTAPSADAIWKRYRQAVQPLVAVVEEPGATVDRLHAVLRQVVKEMKPVGWRQDAGRAEVLGDHARALKILQHGPSPRELDRENLLRGARGSKAKITHNGERPLREDEKGRAYGALDPYHITYTQSAAAALSALPDAPPQVSAVNLAMASAVREEGGRADAGGFPYIDCFSRTLNMQLGPVLFGLTAGAQAGDTALVRFYRDLATAPAVQGVFGRAQRPYTGAPAKSADQTDFLYQSICDFWLRTAELLGHENLDLHPLAFARFTDCIDVMADQYHGVAARDKPGAAGVARANFFRGQAHTHRWLGWSCAAYIRLLEEPSAHGSAGLTEAIRYSETLKGRWKNWPDLTYYVLTDLLVRHAPLDQKAPGLPDSPPPPMVRSEGGNNSLSWTPVAGAKEYRIYRATSPGGPYKWLNSPYVDSPPAALTEPNYVDRGAPGNASYMVSAVDASGRASEWREFDSASAH